MGVLLKFGTRTKWSLHDDFAQTQARACPPSVKPAAVAVAGIDTLELPLFTGGHVPIRKSGIDADTPKRFVKDMTRGFFTSSDRAIVGPYDVDVIRAGTARGAVT